MSKSDKNIQLDTNGYVKIIDYDQGEISTKHVIINN